MRGQSFWNLSSILYSFSDQVLDKGIEPLMTAKAYNGRVLCAWLAQECSDLVQQQPGVVEYQLMCKCLSCP